MNRKNKSIKKPRWEAIAVFVLPILCSLGIFFVYFFTQMMGIYGGDSGDFVASAFRFGIPHPPGYPLYTVLAGIFSHVLYFHTVAWRVGLLSSIPMALSVYFLWKIARYLTRSLFWPSMGVIFFGTMSPVWLHAIGQEVFGLFSLYSSVLIYLMLLWFTEKKLWQLLSISFFSGLAFTHHHLIVLTLVPFVGMTFLHKKEFRKQIRNLWIPSCLLFMLGLIPYLYAPIVSLGNTVIEPGNAGTIKGFFQLVTRASYGTFRAASNITSSLVDRVLNVYTFLQFSFRDFTVVGWLGILIGAVSLRKQNNRAYFFLIGIGFLWIFYFFYAGFPLLINYHMGTVERFVIIPYQILILLFIVGCDQISRFLQSKCIANTVIQRVSVLLFSGIVIGWFTYFSWVYVPALLYLRKDKSMETLGENLSLSIPEKSIVFLFEDTSSYAFYYYYYVLGKRQDVRFIRFPSLIDAEYRDRIGKIYPDLIIPPYDDTSVPGKYIADFFSKNLPNYSIVTDEPQDWLSGVWVPHGLLYVYSPDESYVAPLLLIEEKNTFLWNQFSTPPQLRTYQRHLLLLSDVLRVYAQRRLSFAMYLASHDGTKQTLIDAFEKALSDEISVVPESYVRVIATLLEKKNCPVAEHLLTRVYDKWGPDFVVLSGYHAFVEACNPVDETIINRDILYHKRNPADSLLKQ